MLQYDSVHGVHPIDKTPVFVTYTSGAASYPAYLVTFE